MRDYSNKADVLLGLQWGDEGKGKVVDILAERYDMASRFQGGPNAGHTLEFDGKKFVLHTIPSGIFRPQVLNLVGNGVVIDPAIFKQEIEELVAAGVDPLRNLFISKKAHLILPSHRALDAASEASKGKTKIGSTLKGIGPAYMDKTGRNGLRVGDILAPNFAERYQALLEKHQWLLRQYDFAYDIRDYQARWFEGIELLRQARVVDSENLVNQMLDQGKTVLAEGAQGTLLDIDFGTFPYVTSSNTISAGACTGLGVPPNRIGKVFGVFKAYTTRVGSGPFPTELFDDDGARIRRVGREVGATTGRDRRCGWLDLPALKYAVMVNGVTDLVMTKADVLSGFAQVKVAVEYHDGPDRLDNLPYDMNNTTALPVYRSFEPWSGDLGGLRRVEDFPAALRSYIDFIEQELQVPIRVVSLGPDRSQIVFT